MKCDSKKCPHEASVLIHDGGNHICRRCFQELKRKLALQTAEKDPVLHHAKHGSFELPAHQVISWDFYTRPLEDSEKARLQPHQIPPSAASIEPEPDSLLGPDFTD